MASECDPAAEWRCDCDPAAKRRDDCDSAAKRPYNGGSTAARRSHCDSVAERRDDCDSAAKRRQDVAMGASPWNTYGVRISPNGATRGVAGAIPVAPLGLFRTSWVDHWLTPVATSCRPVGTESQPGRPVGTESPMRLGPARRDDCDPAAKRPYDCDSAAKRRQDVAMGASPWNTYGVRISPNGATRSVAGAIPAAPLGLWRVIWVDHGLTGLLI